MLGMRSAFVLAAAVLGLAAGCGSTSTDDEAGAHGELTVRLAEQNGSAQTGTATFAPLDGDRTRIVLELTNPPDVAQPAHVHSGSCEDLGDPVVALASVVNGRSETEADMSLEKLKKDGLVIHAHQSEAEYDTSVACAPIADEDESEDLGY